ncbi:MAG: KpsF/GutQ family sugar-phosphate isomerase [candidate division Zixibacteria bacterium]|jgi:arabinose-5-phosphate isomerase|nr:KpsF/GutQ family sugar-phosphate isomerase [candidate division Zixibacteria bacterium]
MKKNGLLDIARKTIKIEADAIAALADKLDDNFIKAVDLIDSTKGRVIVSGIGKSGNVAKKIASTFSSIGISAIFFHPTEGIHGDLGLVRGDDLLIAISKSGETEEIIKVIPVFKRLEVPIIALTAEINSLLANDADVILDVSVPQEACPNNLVPTSSTTAAMVMGDALAMALMERRELTIDDFAIYHPGGAIGKSLVKVSQIMHTGDDIPKVGPDTPFSRVVLEMTSKRLGTTTVVDEKDTLLGIITDGDLRRAIEKGLPLDKLVASDVMTSKPKTISSEKLAVLALNRMEKHKITSLAVVNGGNHLLGLIHMHDILNAKII